MGFHWSGLGTDSAAKFGRHSGIDSANATGTNVFAPCDGVIDGYVWGEYHGYVVQIKADDGTYPHMYHNSEPQIVSEKVVEF